VRPVLALEGARLELGAGDAGATVAAAADAVAESTAPRGEPPRWTLGAGLLGGIASGATSEVLAAGLVAVDVTRGWFGASVDVGLSTAATNTVGRGAASSAWQWLSASARLAVPVRERLLLEAQLGVRGYRVTARATGFDEVDPERVQFSVGAVGSVGASFRVVGPFAVTLRLTGNTRRAESFFVSNLGPVLETGPLEGSALAGVVARF
jgi:hypothetical protein